MITVNNLKELGCNVEEGLGRCLNNEAFYLRLVNSVFQDNKVLQLEDALNEKDLQKGFEIAHALKGVYGNLSLTPLYVKTCEITELLRNKVDMDYSPLVLELKELYQSFKSLLD